MKVAQSLADFALENGVFTTHTKNRNGNVVLTKQYSDVIDQYRDGVAYLYRNDEHTMFDVTSGKHKMVPYNKGIRKAKKAGPNVGETDRQFFLRIKKMKEI